MDRGAVIHTHTIPHNDYSLIYACVCEFVRMRKERECVFVVVIGDRKKMDSYILRYYFGLYYINSYFFAR